MECPAFAAVRQHRRFSADIPEHVLRARLAERRIAIAEDEAGVVGVLHLEFLWGTRPYLALISGASERQRRGIGRALLAFSEVALRDAGYRDLFSSSQGNEAELQAWHRHTGFVHCGDTHGLSDGDIGEVRFRKPLE